MSAVQEDAVDTDQEAAEAAARERADEMAAEGDDRGFDQRLRDAREQQGLDPDTAERKTLADLAASEPEPEPEVEQYTLFGSAPSVNTQVKGTRVSSSHVKFKAKAQQLPGQFQMGDVVELRVLVRVDKVEFSSKHDADGNVVETKRVHQLTALSVEQVGEVDEKFSDVDARADAS